MGKSGFNLMGEGLINPIKQNFGKISNKYIVPPFSILNTTETRWLQRKRAWLKLGIESEIGRGDQTESFQMDGFNKNKDSYGKTFDNFNKKGISIFDPVLCELIYSWFCVKQGQVVDPFSGGSVRGLVSNFSGLSYWGCDLNKKQIIENKKQKTKIIGKDDNNLKWIHGDSENKIEIAPKCDLLFSCPPYGNLEKYSDDIEDLSNMDYDAFLVKYNSIIKKSIKKLKKDRFACWVVSDFRDKRGFLNPLVSDTIHAFAQGGMRLYNECILVNPAGSLGIRIQRYFDSGRKIGKRHQNVLIFYKGDPKKIKENYTL